MRLVTTSAAARLTGLSTNQLREWTNRRALIPADVQHRGRGSPSQYSWQTLLLLRMAAVLKNRFHLELHAHRELFASIRESFDGVSILRLWGSSIAIYGIDRWEILEAGADRLDEGESLVLQLDGHLKILTAEFGMPTPAAVAGQLELFPARLVRSDRMTVGIKGTSSTKPSRQRRNA
ncbi:MerR family transcriptional regulator [Bradyrhizobium sp. Arg314]